MTPMLSPLLALQKAIAKAKGAYGAQRVEKAADLVPNLEKMYQMEALEDAFGGDNAKALIVMPPERFEEFARPIFVGDPVHRKMMEDNVKSLQKLRQGFADVPFLEVGHKPGQLPFISGHEGRHRSRALQKRGEKSSLVNVFPKYREDFPRRTQEEFIEEMRRQLGESRLVTPEGKLRATPENPEGAIEFPEIFREGGAVHMKDGSTDKVRQLIEETKGTSGRYDPMRAQRVSEYEKGFRDYLAAQQEARESLFKPSPTVGGMAKGAAGALAGYAAQVPGIAGDILSLYDEFKPERAPNLPEWARAIPTTERLQEYYLPENASPELQAGVTGGNLFALGQGVAALPKVVAGGARMAGKGAQALAPKAAEMTEEYLLRSGLMPQVFIGPSAKTWNPRAAFKASQMERAGKSPEEIWAATKTFKGADGNWRQEISDQSARFLTEADLKAKAAAMYEQERVNRLAIAQSKLHPDLFPKQLTAAQKDLRAQSKALREERTALHGPETNPMWRGNFAKYALEHPELYEAYPELADIIVKQGIPYSPYKAVLNQSAPLKAGDPVSSHISMEITEKGLRDDPRSSALHEMQHAIQGIEGWAPGGNMVTAFLNPKAHDILNSLRQTAMTPMSFEDYAKRFSHVKDLNKGYEAYKASIPSIVKNMDRELQTTAAEQYYRRLAGEAEARATQARRNMSAAERAQVAPGESYDVPINEQIVNPPSYAEGGTVSKDAMRMKSWDKQIQRKDKGGEVTQAEIDAASRPYRMPAPKRRGSIDASGAKAAGTLLSGIASAVPAGYAGLLELARTRDPKMAADAVEALQERYMSMPEDERTAEKIERLSGALETLGEPARLVGETTLRATGSPLAATIAELGLDPMNYLPLIGKAPAAARAAKKAAQNLGPVADQMLENYMLKTGQMLPLNVYHGSPHRFAPTPKNPLGEFDPTKIGTGEGAQAYGYGHYLAEAPGVAKTYQPRSPEYEQKLLEKYNRAQAKRDYTTMEILEDAMLHRSPDEIIQRFTNAEDGYTPAHAKAARDFVNWYAKNPPEVGGLYKVDLPDEQIAKMLDWDKPLSEQPEGVQKVLKDLAERDAKMYGEGGGLDYYMGDPESYSGESVYRYLTEQLSGQPEVSSFLKEAGIPGVKYFDAASRDAGEGTRNFVVFPGGESMLNIISREKKGGMVSEDAMRMKMMDKEVQRKAKGGEIKASPTYPGQELIGRIGQVAEKLGITTAEAMKIVSEKGNSPIKAFIGDLIAGSMKSAGTALQDWTGTPREITEEQPYSRLISGKGMTTRIDPRALDVAGFGQPVASRLTSAARGLPQAVKEAAIAAYGPGATASHVVKPKGGNWLTGSVEDALNPLKSGMTIRGFTPVPEAPPSVHRASALDNWVDKQLTRYIKNEMGTPEDPVRLAADAFPATKAQMLADKQKQIDKAVADMEKARAVRNFTPEMMTSSQARIRELQKEKELLELRMGLHFGPENVPEIDQIFNAGAASARRMGYFPVEGIAKSDIAKFWEQASDARIKVLDPKKLDSYFGSRLTKNVIEDNPWLERLDPNTPVYNFGGKSTDVGFDHLIDELRNATNPESGLPRNLLINSKDLPKWTVPQAIEHVDKINAWRAVQRQEAAKAVREGIPVHKEYPEGYQWLSVPDLATDEKALRYATDIGCEGGWCTQGEETARQYGGGGNRLFVLHDPKGKPVVQIQVEQFGKGPLSGDALNEVEPGLFEKFLAQRDQEGGTHDMHKWLQTTRPDLANRESIGQIKGILNKPPKPEYLPFVQDFVRSGQWSDIGDIQNTGMRAAQQVFNENELLRLKELGQEVPPILTGEEIQNLHNAITPEGMRLKYDAKGNVIGSESKNYARGGAVKACDCNDDAIKMAVWDKQIQRKAGGGAVKKMSGGSLVRAGTKAASAAKALTSAGKSADEMAEVRKVAPEGQQNVQEILEPKSNVGKGAGKASDLVTDLRAAPKVGVASPLATRSAADKAEEALQKTQAFKSLKGQDRQRAIDSVRAKAERSGIPRTKADLNAAMAGEEDIARSMLNSPAYKIANVVPRATVNKALETRQMYRAEPPTTPGPNASEKEWADWGASHGVNMTVTTPESLGISDLMSRREAMIPGGLKGTFTIPDLFWIKANNFNPAALPQDVHTELMKKFIRTFKINSPDEVDVFNRLNFALLSPNAPLTPNEFLAQRARLRTPEELSALAGRVGEEGLNRTAAAQLGVGQAGSGGMGVLGTADLSSQAMLAKLIKDKPSMFQMAPGETMRDVTMRVMNQAPGLGPKTASLGTPWLDLEKANTSAVDLHMIRDAYPMLLHDPIVGKAFRERMAGLLKTKPTAAAILSKPEKDVRDAAIAIVGGTDMSRLYRLKSGELNRIPDVATPDKLAYEPKSFSEFNPFYSRVVDYVDQSRGANPDIELFPEQWRKWDVLRQRIEPHEFAHPDYRKLPRQSFSEMQNALTAHKEAGYTQSNNPTMNLSDWRKLYYGRAVPEILAPTAAAGAAAAAAQTLLSDDSEKARGGAVHMAEGGLTSDDLILEERKL